MSEAGNWCLIESDPGVFTELISKFGVSGVQVEELWSLEADHFRELKPVYGLIFLFKWLPEEGGETKQANLVQDSRLEEIFFAKQVINNACATQAILSVLMNLSSDGPVTLGPTLGQLKEFTQGFDANMKGLTLSNSDQIRTVHNSFARQTLFEFDSKKADKDDDVFHFVSFVPIKGRVYELDGLQAGPIDHGGVGEGGDWLDVVRPVIEARMEKYSQGTITFNLMALIGDRKQLYSGQLASQPPLAAPEVARLEELLAAEEVKRARWATENLRRRHNYLPLIMELLRALASRGELVNLYNKAKEKSVELERKKQEKKVTKA